MKNFNKKHIINNQKQNDSFDLVKNHLFETNKTDSTETTTMNSDVKTTIIENNKEFQNIKVLINSFIDNFKSTNTIEPTMLLKKTWDNCFDKHSDDEESYVYSKMLTIADEWKLSNPFKSKEQFYKYYNILKTLEEPLSWDNIVRYFTINNRAFPVLSNEVVDELKEQIEFSVDFLFIPNADYLLPHLKKILSMVEKYSTITTISFSNESLYIIAKEMFSSIKTLTIEKIDKNGLNKELGKYNLIIATPAIFKLDDDISGSFICREGELAAAEKYLSCIADTNSKMILFSPLRLTFAQGRVKKLRDYIIKNYKIEEISELPGGTFSNTNIKYSMLTISCGKSENIKLKKYSACQISLGFASTILSDLHIAKWKDIEASELEKADDWNIDRLLGESDEKWQDYISSPANKIELCKVASVFRGKAISSRSRIGEYGVINISNLLDNKIDFSNLTYIDEEERKVSNYLLKNNDLLLPARGNVIRATVFNQQSFPCIASSNVIVIRPDTSKLNATYLKIFLESPIGISLIKSMQQGFNIVNISYQDFKTIKIPLIPIKKQLEIAIKYDTELSIRDEQINNANNRWQKELSKLRNLIFEY